MTCKYWGCDKPARDDGQDAFANQFCSAQHEVKYDHIKADAQDAMRADMEPEDEL